MVYGYKLMVSFVHFCKHMRALLMTFFVILHYYGFYLISFQDWSKQLNC